MTYACPHRPRPAAYIFLLLKSLWSRIVCTIQFLGQSRGVGSGPLPRPRSWPPPRRQCWAAPRRQSWATSEASRSWTGTEASVRGLRNGPTSRRRSCAAAEASFLGRAATETSILGWRREVVPGSLLRRRSWIAAEASVLGRRRGVGPGPALRRLS